MNSFILNTFLFTLIVFLQTISVNAQHPYYYQINSDQLPVKEVYEILQDSKGNIWIGSKNGLYEYNGNNFISVKSNEFPISSLSSIHEDKYGRIWVRNFRGEIFFAENHRMNYFINWKDSIREFPSILIDHQNTLWIGARNGLYNYNVSTSEWTLHKFEENETNLPQDYTSATLYNGPDSSVIVVSLNEFPTGIYRNGILKAFKSAKESKLNHEGFVFHKVFKFGKSSFLYSRDNKIFKVMNDSLIFIKDLSAYGFFDNDVYWLTELKNGMLAIGSKNGMHLFDENFLPIKLNPILKGNKVSSILEDKEGNIWVSTLNNGIFVIPNLEVITYNSTNFNFPDNGIYSMDVLGNDKLYLGFSKGQIGVLDNKFNFNLKFSSRITNEISCLSYNFHRKELFFFHGANLYKINSSDKVINTGVQLSAPKEISSYDDYILIASSSGTSLITLLGSKGNQSIAADLKSNQLTKIDMSALNNKSGQFSDHYMFRQYKKSRTALIDTVNYRIWSAYNEGLFFSDISDQKEFKIQGQTVYANKIDITSDGTIWIATSSHGLIAIKDTLLTSHEITNNPVITLKIYNEDVYYSTIDGLFKRNTQTGETTVYNKYDGVNSSEISAIEVFNNLVFVGTPEGLISFPGDKNFLNTVPPGIEIANVSIWEKDTTILSSYILPYNRNNISVGFHGISMKSRGDYKIMYRMVGLSDNWITVSSFNNVARFPSLPPGSWLFQVKSVNEDGIESENYAQINFVIKPPFWDRWWFYFLVLLLIAAMISAVFLIRIDILRKRSNLEKLLKSSEIVAIKAQMNPHFIFNALNSIQDLVLQKEIRNSTDYLGKFSDLLRMVLEVSGEEFISLKREAELLETYLNLEKLRFKEDFNYSLSYEKLSTAPEHLLLPSMIIQPYVENAIKHGLLHKSGEKEIRLVFREEQNSLICHIKDNGVGRKKAEDIKARRSKVYKAFATDANRKRVDLINDIYSEKVVLITNDLFEGENAIGTEVIISFPKRFI